MVEQQFTATRPGCMAEQQFIATGPIFRYHWQHELNYIKFTC